MRTQYTQEILCYWVGYKEKGNIYRPAKYIRQGYETLYTDFIYIIEQGKIALNGTPFNVLQKDNTINKIGLSLPFMIDLSVKLRDYELVDELETDIDRMIDKLWN